MKSEIKSLEDLAALPLHSVVLIRENGKIVNAAYKNNIDEWTFAGLTNYNNSLQLWLYAVGGAGLTLHQMKEI